MRLLNAQAFITLPRLSDDETASLVTRLVTQVDVGGHHVPASAGEAFEALKAAGAALAGASRPAPTAKGGAVRDAHLAVLHAWSACEQWLGGFAALDDGDDPRVPTARRLYATLFGEGLGFANARVEVEWTRSERKIAAVKDAHLAKSFAELGGDVFWKKILAAHAAEGDVAHLTSAAEPAAPAVDAHEKALAAQDAMREYVAHVVGTVRRAKPATQALADALLQPIAAWTSSPSAAAKPAPASPPAAPAPKG